MSTYQELPSIYRLKRSLTDVDQIANEYFEKVLDLNPVQATELGRKGVETLYPDYSPAGEKAFARLAKKTLKKVDNVLPIDDVDLVTLDALQGAPEPVPQAVQGWLWWLADEQYCLRPAGGALRL